MDQFKVSVDEILYSDLTDAQLLAIVRLQALTAQLEQAPTDKQMKRIISAKSRKNLLNIDPKMIEEQTNFVLTQVELVIKKRGYSKTKMRQIREKTQDVTGNVEECYRSKKEIKRKEKEKGTNVPKKCEVIEWDYFINLWEDLVSIAPAIKDITKLTEGRKKKLRARSKEHQDFNQAYLEALKNIKDSEYLQGSKGWTITFDWLIHSESNFTKVYEGNYNNVSEEQARQQRISNKIAEYEQRDSILEEFRRRKQAERNV